MELVDSSSSKCSRKLGIGRNTYVPGAEKQIRTLPDAQEARKARKTLLSHEFTLRKESHFGFPFIDYYPDLEKFVPERFSGENKQNVVPRIYRSESEYREIAMVGFGFFFIGSNKPKNTGKLIFINRFTILFYEISLLYFLELSIAAERENTNIAASPANFIRHQNGAQTLHGFYIKKRTTTAIDYTINSSSKII